MSLPWKISTAGSLLLAILITATAAQDEPSSITSFFRVLQTELSAAGVFAVDAKSVAESLETNLGWMVSQSDVERLLGTDFEYGHLSLFMYCDFGGCAMARPGAHASLANVRGNDDQVVLYLDQTGEESLAPFRAEHVIILQRSGTKWSVVTSGEGHSIAGAR